ncbi:MAG TPA: hypothetical protein VEV84_11760 [Pyrinomonadaceae bacterium]|nr:hypothetical protein [Pyrinomonadaceae bacterium]
MNRVKGVSLWQWILPKPSVIAPELGKRRYGEERKGEEEKGRKGENPNGSARMVTFS